MKKYATFTAVSLQGFFLIHLSTLSIREVVAASLTCLLLGFIVLIIWKHRKGYRHLDFLLVTASIGGLGMVLGFWLDLQFASSHQTHDIISHHNWSWQHLFSFQTGVMLFFCILACEVLCTHDCANLTVGKRILRSFECHISMLVGMFIGGYVLAPVISTLIKTPALSAHFSMLVGMVAGMWVGLKLFDLQRSVSINL